MPRNRSRNYALSDQDIIQILDFDDSDEDCSKLIMKI